MAAGMGYELSLEGMADVYNQQKQYDKEAAMYRKLVYVQPDQEWITSRSNDCDVRMRFALALYRLGQYDEALMNYRKGLETLRHRTIDAPINIRVDETNASSDTLPYVAHLALAAQRVDFDNAEAIAHCRAAIALHPHTAIGHYYLGYILHLTAGGKAEARTEMETVAQSHDNSIRLVAAQWLQKRGYENDKPTPDTPAASEKTP